MPTQKAAKPAADSSKKILLVDDDLTLAEMYTERLKAEGFQLAVVHDGEAALKAIQEKKPDLVLLDIMMPKLNGLDVLKRLSADPELSKTKVLLLTALVQDSGKVSEISKHALGYIVKSQTTPGELIAKIKSLL